MTCSTISGRWAAFPCRICKLTPAMDGKVHIVDDKFYCEAHCPVHGGKISAEVSA